MIWKILWIYGDYVGFWEICGGNDGPKGGPKGSGPPSPKDFF